MTGVNGISTRKEVSRNYNTITKFVKKFGCEFINLAINLSLNHP